MQRWVYCLRSSPFVYDYTKEAVFKSYALHGFWNRHTH